MKIKGAVFDIGRTLVYYPVPLNWSALYRPAFESIAAKNGLAVSEDEYAHIVRVLSKYNTGIDPGENEVTSDEILAEIPGGTNIPLQYPDTLKRDLYSFFRTDVRVRCSPGRRAAKRIGGEMLYETAV